MGALLPDPPASPPGTGGQHLPPEGKEDALLIPYTTSGAVSTSITAAETKPNRKPRMHKTDQPCTRQESPARPGSVHPRPDPTPRTLIRPALPDCESGEGRATSECSPRVAWGGCFLAPVSASTRPWLPALLPRYWQPSEALPRAASGDGNMLRKTASQAPFWDDVALGITTQTSGRILFSGSRNESEQPRVPSRSVG